MSFIPNDTLNVTYYNGTYWEVLTPFTYVIDDTTEVIVPKGFLTDLASVPQLFWNILPPQGDSAVQYGPAAVVHDYLYRFGHVFNYKTNTYQQIDRVQADNILFQAMTELKVMSVVKYLIYYGVRIGGSSSWNFYSLDHHTDSKGP